MKVRRYLELVVILLQKPTDSVGLDAASVPVFVEMLADPCPLEPEFKVCLTKLKPVRIKVGTSPSGKVVLAFDTQTEIISMSKQQAAKLGADVTKATANLIGATC